jgi:hypothetical protein
LTSIYSAWNQFGCSIIIIEYFAVSVVHPKYFPSSLVYNHYNIINSVGKRRFATHGVIDVSHQYSALILFVPTLFIFATQRSRHNGINYHFPTATFYDVSTFKSCVCRSELPVVFSSTEPTVSAVRARTADILPLDRKHTQWKICIYHV